MSRAGKLREEKGQTLALVAVAMVSFIAMSALAIDLTSLYSAHSEIQRAADAAALAGAKAFVDSGVTTIPKTLQSTATTLATNYADAAAAQNLVAGIAPQVISVSPDFRIDGNPRVTVQLQRTNLPLFFSHIWSGNFGNVSATAVAEAYNPSFPQSTSGSYAPIAPKCVKPILMPNMAPRLKVPFVDTTSGEVTPGQRFVGLGPFDVGPARCNPSNANCSLQGGDYLPMLVIASSSTASYCPSSSAPGCGGPNPSDYQKSIECCNGAVFNAPQCGKGVAAAWDPRINPGSNPSPVTSGLMCLIHSTGSGITQQDSLDPTAFGSGRGLLVSPGSFSQARYGLGSTDLVATSDSIITVPLFDDSSPPLPANNRVTIVGFLTLFVTHTNSRPGRFSATVLNVAGCGTNASGLAISGGGVSSIPVRLIH